MFEKEAEEYAEKSKSNFVVNEYGSTVFTQLDIEQAYQKGAEPREKRIAELEAQIEKMKCDVIECFGNEYNILVAKLLNKWEIKEK